MCFSVIIPVYRSHATLERCIEGLQRQDFRDVEIIFVDSSPDERSAAIIKRTPSFRLVRSEQRLWMYAARNLGARHAQGIILVFTDPDCIPAPNWLTELDRSFQQGHHVVGGPISFESNNYIQQLSHFVKFWLWLPGSADRTTTTQPTANLAVERVAFDSVRGFPEDFFSGDSLFCRRLQDNGHKIFFNTQATIEHLHEGVTVKSLVWERFLRGMDFAYMRATLPEWSSGKSAVFLVVFWILPLRQALWRLVVAAQRGSLGKAIILSPLVLLCDCAWMTGQAVAFWRLLWKLPPMKLMN